MKINLNPVIFFLIGCLPSLGLASEEVKNMEIPVELTAKNVVQLAVSRGLDFWENKMMSIKNCAELCYIG